ncbi:glycosyltransferase family 4 protein [Polynucleobacter paneuropaeus]|nr:glycosyltransferase family 4 protein [Polynucleobacter paneuropaeus]
MKLRKKNNKQKIVLDGAILSMALDNVLARTGIFFVVKNLCEALIQRADIELKIMTPDINIERLYREYPNFQTNNSFDLTSLRVGVEHINFLMPHQPASAELFEIPHASVFQIIHDFAGHACPELKNLNHDFEKSLISGLNPKGFALCVSKNTQNDLIRFANYPRARSGVFYPGVKNEIEMYLTQSGMDYLPSIYELLDIPVDAHYILSVSTIEPRKNLATSLRAFQYASEALEPLDLYFVITGAQGWVDIRGMLDEVPEWVLQKIRFSGYLDDLYIPHLYRDSICLLYPSFYEGFGMPVIEAMACGTPVIVSDRGSLPEVAGNCAKVFDAYDANGMARVITEWYKDSNMRSNAGSASRDYAKKFSWDRSVDQIVDFIGEVNPSD